MFSFSCKEIAEVVAGKLIGANLEFSGICIDSRKVKTNDMFVVIKGAKVDPIKFVDSAIENGASCLLVSCELKDAKVPYILVTDPIVALGKIGIWHRNKFNPKIAAITGSVGKTSTRGMLVSILEKIAPTLNPSRNFNTDITVPITLLRLEAQHEYAVMEMGACNKNHISYLMGIIKPDLSLITNIGPSHLSTFGDLDGVANAKGEAYDFLKPDGIAVINVDDAYAPFLLSKLTKQKIITFSMHSKADISGKSVAINAEQITFTLLTDIGEATINLPTVGLHNVINAIAAAACARGFGIGLEQIKQGLEDFSGVSRRLEVRKGLDGAKIIDDSYNASPISVKSALISLKNDTNKNKIFVFSDMKELGDQEIEFHKEIGRFAKKAGINSLLTIGNLAKHTHDNFAGDAKFYPNKADLIVDLKSMLNKNTTVLVKGSQSQGMEEVVKYIVNQA